MVLRPPYQRLQWFAMVCQWFTQRHQWFTNGLPIVSDHWSSNGIVSMDCTGLRSNFRNLYFPQNSEFYKFALGKFTRTFEMIWVKAGFELTTTATGTAWVWNHMMGVPREFHIRLKPYDIDPVPGKYNFVYFFTSNTAEVYRITWNIPDKYKCYVNHHSNFPFPCKMSLLTLGSCRTLPR